MVDLARPSSVLEEMHAHFAAKAWPATDLARFRMGPDEEEAEAKKKAEDEAARKKDEEGKGGKDAVLADLAKERDKRQALEAEREDMAKQLKELQDRDKSEGEKLAERAANAEGDLSKAQRKAIQLEVGLDKGLPKSLAMRLQGDTQEEMEKDADELLKQLKPGAKSPSFDGGAKENGHEGGGSFLAQALRNRRNT